MQAAFTIPGEPIGQPRPRASVRAGHAFVYDDKTHPVQAFKAACRLAFSSQHQGAPTGEPVELQVVAYFPRPKSMLWKKRAMPRVRHAKKPDIDNVIKAVQDALNGLAYQDDSQIVQVVAMKWTCSGDEQPRTEVAICLV